MATRLQRVPKKSGHRAKRNDRTQDRHPGQSRFENPASQDPSISLEDLQRIIRDMYLPRDIERGIEGTFMWLVEEVGELATALRHGSKAEQSGEFADVLAWLATIANVSGIDLNRAVAQKYGRGCPGCQSSPCVCAESEKP